MSERTELSYTTRTPDVEPNFDRQYLERLIGRDPATEEHFIRYFGDLIRIVVLSRAGAWNLVEDVRQETFLRVLRMLREQGGLERPERLGAFVYSVCRRVLAEQIREQADLSKENPDYQPRCRMLLDESLIRQESRREIEKALKDLTPLERDAIRMVFLEERDRDEVRRRLGLSADYLRVILCRAKARLRERLKRTGTILASKSSRYNGTPHASATQRGSKITD